MLEFSRGNDDQNATQHQFNFGRPLENRRGGGVTERVKTGTRYPTVKRDRGFISNASVTIPGQRNGEKYQHNAKILYAQIKQVEVYLVIII